MSLQMGAKNTIIYIGGFELPDKNAAAQRVIGNAKALRDIGYEVVFVDIDKDTHESILNTKNEIYGFIRYSMQYTNKRLVSIADFKLVFSEYGSSICAIIAYNYPSVALSKMRKFCKLQNVKIIADCTEWYGAQGKNFIKMIIKGMDSFFRMNVIQPKLDGIITISRYLENYYKEKIPTICVPPLVDLSDIKWATKEEKKRNEVRIVYAGNPGMHKDKVNRMVEALAKINRHDTIFEIIGITKSDFLEYYPNEKKSVQMLGDRINFRGRISHECVIKAIKQETRE